MSLKDVQAHLDEERGRLESIAAEIHGLLGKEESRAELPQSLRKRDYYDIFRAYRLAEQNLLNHRLTWNLNIQGFLFATYGFSLQKLAELQAGESNAHVDQATHTITQLTVLLIVIPAVGFMLSLCVWFAVLGAKLVLEKLVREWKSNVETKYLDGPYLPDPAGGGIERAIQFGFYPPLLIPSVFAFAWLIILFIFIWTRWISP